MEEASAGESLESRYDFPFIAFSRYWSSQASVFLRAFMLAFFDTAMTAVEGVVMRAGIGPGIREEALDFSARNRPVVLESEQIALRVGA